MERTRCGLCGLDWLGPWDNDGDGEDEDEDEEEAEYALKCEKLGRFDIETVCLCSS